MKITFYPFMNRAMTILLTHKRMIISRQPEKSVISGVGELPRIDGAGYLITLIKL